MSEPLTLAVLGELVPDGFEYGTNHLIEFDSASLWYETSLTIASKAIQHGMKCEYHVLQHVPRETKHSLESLGLETQRLIDQTRLRIIDYFTPMTKLAKDEDTLHSASWRHTQTFDLKVWGEETRKEILNGINPVDKRWLHIDDNLSVMLQLFKEDDLLDFFRTILIPWTRARELLMFSSVVTGVASDAFYRKFEALSDGVIEFVSREEGGVIQQYVRVKVARGKSFDSRLQPLRLTDEGSVSLARRSGMDKGGRRLAAIMFTDIANYAGQAQENEELALELLEEHRKILRSIFPRYSGREVKTIGDGFLVEFASALEAANCAVEIQRTLNNRNSGSPPEKQVHVRIGIHVGDIVEKNEDIVGDGVNIAARIEPLAEPGGICITQQVYDQIQNKVGQQLVKLGPRSFKHILTPIEVYKVDLAIKRVGTRQPGLEKRRIAVLPLSNVSEDPKDEYFAEGMTDEIRSTLSKIAGFGVIARTSSIKYRGATKSVAEIGKELNVGTVIEGSIRKFGKRIRIMVQAIDTTREEPLWSQEYDRDLEDIFAVQSDIAKRTAGALKVKILQFEAEGLGKKATEDTEAYTLYLKGRYFWNKRTERELKSAIQYFERALRRDGRFALAYTGLADSYSLLALFEIVPPKKAFPKAKAAAGKALDLDEALAEAHTSLGLVRFQYDRDWPDAEAEFKRAIELNSNYAPAHHFYADFLKAMGRFDEALLEIKRAQELDPLSLAINTGVGHVLYLSRNYDKAIEQYRHTVELDPNFLQARLWFGRPYLQKGLYKEAIAELQKAVELSGGSTIALAMLGHAYASGGKRKEALEMLNTLKKRAKTKYVPSYWIATIYNGLGDKDNAFTWLEKAFRERSSWLAWVKVEPRFDTLRADPRFKSLLKRMKLS